MVTTIQVSGKLQDELSKRKLFDRETYEEVIWNIMEDTMVLNDQTKQELEEVRREIKHGKYKTLSEIEKSLK